MIRELLELLFVRQLSYMEAEKELGIDRATMQSRIDMLVHMGYLLETTLSMEGCEGGCMGWAKNTIPECGSAGENGSGGSETLDGDSGTLHGGSGKIDGGSGKIDGGVNGGEGGDSKLDGTCGDVERGLTGYELTGKGKRVLKK